MPDSATIDQGDAFLCVAPLIYIAWADGILEPDEIRAIRDQVRELPPVAAAESETVDAWLDPEEPPTQTRLLRLLRAIRERADELPEDTRGSLAELGAALGGHSGDEEAVAALRDIERALGVAGREAVDRVLGREQREPVRQTFDEPEARVSADRLRDALDGDHGETWERVRTILSRDTFTFVRDVPKEEHREQVLEWTKALADEELGTLALPAELGGPPTMTEFVHAFSALAYFDLSLVVKFGVQFGLWGGSVRALGTAQQHERWLPATAAAELLGGFAMTETGHGSNVREIETTATYDSATEEFVIHTPSESAQKDWIGNAGKHGRIMSVFAQLIIDDEEYGVHVFVVPIRDDEGNDLPGVETFDCGLKMGLNGVDNGRIRFDGVRVPRENLLGRFAKVAADGTYSSPIESAGKRFFTMLGTLVGGRVCVGFSAVTASRVALAIAVRYGALRRQFGPAGGPERTILDYPVHQQRLMPHLAATYALHYALSELAEEYGSEDDVDPRRLEARAAALKALATRHAIEASQTARECCGGQGFLSANRISEIRRDIDVFATFEGDNIVLLQLVAKTLLSDYKDDFDNDFVFALAKEIAKRATTELLERNPVVTRKTDEEHLDSSEFHLDALRFRRHNLLVSAARRIKRRIDDGVEPFEAFTQIQDHLVELARAAGDVWVVEAFVRAVGEGDYDEATREALDRVRALDGVTRIHRQIGWYAENGYVSAKKVRAIRKRFGGLCAEVRRDALALVDGFGVPASCMDVPIAHEGYVGRLG